jgi:2-polyprenyl-3-methyl-5-hydroxy-6-metoxy-1,4-benzoquinol methylase
MGLRYHEGGNFPFRDKEQPMATPSQSQRPSPERIFGVLTAFQSSAALKAAIELDLFTAIAEGADRVSAIAQRVNAAERGVRILCDYLTIHDFLAKEEDRYSLTQESAVFLNRRSPAYLGTMTSFLTNESHKKNFEALTAAVRKGGTSVAQGDNTKPNDELWVTFAKSMAPLTTVSAGFIAELAGAKEGKASKVLDIAAGHGMFGITVAKQNPNAQITAVDWAPVLAVAKENAAAAGVADRVSFRPGSAFEADLGEGYDIVLLTNIFHHFDMPTCEKLMRRVHAALQPGGKAITLEFVPNEDRVTPPMAAAFSLIMLAGTDAGDAYTFSQYEKMFKNAGFRKTTLHPVPDMPQQVLLSEK